MASPYIQLSDLSALASNAGYNEKPHLSQLSAVFLLSSCLVMRQRWLWQNPISPITDATYELILEMIDQAESDLMTSQAIGSIIASVSDLSANDSYLLLDGSTVAQVDYPLLYDVVPASWISGTDIVLPDMSDTGLFGSGISNVGDISGENNVTLAESEIPSHTHTQNPHLHSEIIPAVTPTGAGPIVAGASVVIPTPSTTGLTTATNNNTGGGNSHNNIQQSLNVSWWLVAQ